MSALERLLDAARRLIGSARTRRHPPEDVPATSGYAGDYAGTPQITYAPVEDALPDPGEVVWAWVPYEEDHGKGKDRPVLVIGRDGDLLLALQLSSQDHDRDAADEARWGRYWVDVGTGAWDSRNRPSEARVDRILRLAPTAVRRIGAQLDRERFDEVAAGVREHAR
ncbi:type II toxin-antitoxin system PemK/MazF family toxin [Ornithinimicrobium cavernae]|uniref:type II toxin-antitoxin system PemK/MazF family toxin n=1 Tax=Ornithinimicrobium cavernae TaxID=2666047 RepID=UPI000D68D274|nr:type II toxin-antitoxin system PemK/MazF family toxin [Ornithinimicrobium cavernae]